MESAEPEAVAELERLLPGDSELACRMRTLDWSASPLGAPPSWPHGLQSAARACLASPSPTALCWGPDHALLYNDACIPFLDLGHPHSLGRSARECGSQLWRALAPLHERVLRTGLPALSEDLPLFLARHVACEEVYVRIELAPVLGADGRSVDGVLCTCTETTQERVSERRLATLRELGEQNDGRRAIDAACAVLAQCPYDVAFGALYVVDNAGRGAVLRATAGLAADHPLPLRVAEDDRNEPWPLAAVLCEHKALELDGRDAPTHLLPGGAWPEPARPVVVLPVRGATRESLGGLLVLGASARRPWDTAYRTFFALVADQLSAVLARAHAAERERELRALARELHLQKGVLQQLHETTLRLVGASPDDLLPGLLDSALALTGAEMGSMQMVDSVTGELQLVAQRGFGPAFPDLFATLRPGVVGTALFDVSRVVIEDVATSPLLEGSPVRDVLLSEGVRAVQSTPLLDRAGELLGMLSTHRRRPHRPTEREIRLLDLLARPAADLIDRFRSEQALRDREEWLRLASQTGKLGLWQWDVASSRITWTQSMYAVHGLDPAVFHPTVETLAEIVHPDDRRRVERAGRRAIEKGEPYEIELRTRAADGRTVWIFTSARVVREEGRPVRMLGASLDVTSRKEAELALRRSEERFRVALGSSTVGFTLLRAVRGGGGEIIDFESEYANAAALRLVRPATRHILGRRIEDVLPGNWERHPTLFAGLCRVVETGEPEEVEVYDEPTQRWFRNILAQHGDGAAIWFADETASKQTEVALREADRRKDEFLATLAHELRNPLAPIRNAVELLRLQGSAEPAIAWARDVIDRQSQHMSRLIDDLLEVSRMTSGRLQLRMQPIELARIVEMAIETTGPLIGHAEHRLHVDVPAEPIVVAGDPGRLAQVLANLLNNAARYTERGGQIELRVLRRATEACIAVRDNGAGIPPEMLSKIFDLFTQVDRSLERTQGGLGIGLALAKRLVEMHGGRIEAASAGVGLGSCFTVYLPLLAAPSETPAEGESGSSAGPPSTSLRILLADDNADAVESLAMLLRLHGHQVVTAHDGAEALRIALETAPDVALLDIGMPMINGYDIARRIREEAVGQRILLIALTGWGLEEDRRRSAEAGFHHHLVKPVDPAHLLRILTTATPAPR
jgi:PAS domain S-box-containing protein